MSLVEKLKSGCIQAQKRWSGDCGEMSLVDEHKTDAVMAEAAKKIEELQKTIDALRAEIKEARAVIRNAAKTVQAFREQAEKLREQRDRAIKAANRLADLDDEGWDCIIESIRELEDEISKEKETK